MSAELNFVRQQGFADATPATCLRLYPALTWQPRAVGVLLLVLVPLGWWPGFGALAAVLWWGALAPRANPFDLAYDRAVAAPRGLPPIPPAPAPRRFAQGVAGTLAAGIALALHQRWTTSALVMQGTFLTAVAALAYGRFCLGSFLYHLLLGDARVARRTLPWSRAR
ncbi:MAG TPA: DUF4395 family protein [Gemmatimonadales bacterium]|nr:DUF4395 family protein [Gemmatimonadales bacterium]